MLINKTRVTRPITIRALKIDPENNRVIIIEQENLTQFKKDNALKNV